jgi:hypothetical protein
LWISSVNGNRSGLIAPFADLAFNRAYGGLLRVWVGRPWICFGGIAGSLSRDDD